MRAHCDSRAQNALVRAPLPAFPLRHPCAPVRASGLISPLLVCVRLQVLCVARQRGVARAFQHSVRTGERRLRTSLRAIFNIANTLMSSARLCASDPLQAEKQHVRSRGAAQPTDVTTDFVLLRLTPRASAQSNLLTESMNAACYNGTMNAACYYGTAGCAACLSPPSAISMSKSTFC